MSHFAVPPFTDACPTCKQSVGSDFTRSGVTKGGESIAWVEFYCVTCRVKWVMVSELSLTTRLK